MADWDPLGEPESSPGEALGDASASKADDFFPINESDLKMSKKDMERMFLDLERKLDKDSPWKSMPDPRPDLSWRKPTCTLEDWKHNDVKVALGKSIAYVTLNRPADNNILSDGVVAGLCDAVILLHGRPDIRVVVFSAEGKMFCAGRDPKGDNYGFNIQPPAATPKALEEDGKEALEAGAFPGGNLNMGRLLQGRLWQAWSTLPQFTISLVNGSAMGDGIGCVLCSDVAIALKTAFFDFSETKLGLVNAGISPYLMAKTSAGAVKNMFVLGQVLSAETALAKGIVNRVVDSIADGNKVIAELCGEVTKCGPRSVQLAKELVQGVAGRQMDETIMFYVMLNAAAASRSEEAKQSAKASADGKPKPWEVEPIAPLH
mmetsp:Transcript_86978/g.218913  ORF Transcript_86978/g.218913 Transcript_86978/m.218913 type:complete len:375 (-) Transcript_86978:327-1451(-)